MASRHPRPPGDTFHFEVQLASGEVALSGEGKVIWVKEFNPDEPQKPHGMGVQFISIDGSTRATLNQILNAKRPPRATPAGGNDAGMMRSGEIVSPSGNRPAPAPRIDTTVDLAAEYGLDESALRRAIDRVRTAGVRPDEDLDALKRAEASEPATLAQALAELPRLLDPARRRTGPFRTTEIPALLDRTGPMAAIMEADNDARRPTEAVQPAHDESTTP